MSASAAGGRLSPGRQGDPRAPRLTWAQVVEDSQRQFQEIEERRERLAEADSDSF